MADRCAVLVRNARKWYGQEGKSDYKLVLDNLDMTVERGTIYGLLGPSGCGKTTLLSCIVGRRVLASGEVWVLGGKPGEKGSGVPGPRVGYMPQDVALVGEFTVQSALCYFGRVFGMPDEKIEERITFLMDLLDLPTTGNMVKNMSGGQQRRISLAGALIHEPELLILDEPTVGLDPVLREKIWNFLVELTHTGTTVIITTHYIDETKQANRIGLLRGGELLAEDSPAEILRQYECETLEEAFFKMASKQTEQPRRRSARVSSPEVIPSSTLTAKSRDESNGYNRASQYPARPQYKSTSRKRYKAVFYKCAQQYIKQPTGLVFSAIFPIIQLLAFFFAVGRDPSDLDIIVINEEAAMSPWGINACKNSSLTYVTLDEEEIRCDLHMMSCWYIEEMERQKLYPKPFNNSEDARMAVLEGKYFASVEFKTNFSENIGRRVREGVVYDEEVVNNGTVHIWIDMTNFQVSNFVKMKLYKIYETFGKRAMKACHREEKVTEAPININDPVWGEKEMEFITFMAPGIMITILFFLSTIVTSSLLTSDRLEGVWERSAVAGVTPTEMLLVHIVIQTIIIIVQSVEVLILAFPCYNLPSKGSIALIAALMFFQGISGMSYGFLLSIVCNSDRLVFFLTTGSFYPMTLLCGILWPLEAMPYGLQLIAYVLPFTFPIVAMRDLMIKGYDLTHQSIYTGFGVTFVWNAIALAICFLVIKFKKS